MSSDWSCLGRTANNGRARHGLGLVVGRARFALWIGRARFALWISRGAANPS